MKKLGYSADYAKYTLCQSMYASFQLIGVAPVVFVNVLAPKKHKKTIEAKTVSVEDMEATFKVTGLLLDTVKVSIPAGDSGAATLLAKGTDYLLSFDGDGQVLITLTAAGAGAAATALSVEGTAIDPDAVKANDVIGASATGGEKGFEVLRQVYPKLGMTPGLILAPGWSHIPDVGIVLEAKCEEINGYFSCECFVDIDSNSTTGCASYDKVKTAKEGAGCTGTHAMALWPCPVSGSKKFRYSAVIPRTPLPPRRRTPPRRLRPSSRMPPPSPPPSPRRTPPRRRPQQTQKATSAFTSPIFLRATITPVLTSRPLRT